MPDDDVDNEVDPSRLKFRLGGMSFDPHRLIYATIILMTAFAIYDQGDVPLAGGPLLTMIGVALAPVFALAMAHAFSDALDMQIRYGRRLTARDRRHLAAENLEYLYIAIPPILLAIVLTLLAWNADDIVAVIQILGILSLAWWGAFAARAAGLSAWSQVRFALSYSVMGAVVIFVELALTH